MNEDHDRFLHFYDQLVLFTHDAVKRLPAGMLHWKPPTDADVRFGERVEDVTVENLYLHLVVGEHLWVRNLAAARPEETIPLPLDKEMEARLSQGNYLAESLVMHSANMEILRSFDAERLATPIVFSNHRWSVGSFLWAIYGHRNYHIGNIDTFCRLAGAPAPDYFQFRDPELL